MDFPDNTDRDAKQSKDIDGCDDREVVEVDGEHEVSLGITASDCFFGLTFSCQLMGLVCHPNRSPQQSWSPFLRVGWLPELTTDQHMKGS
jgi:hypothetical protein